MISHNRLVGNRIGVTVRRLRNLTVERNEATGNCAAVFVVGDEGKPRAGAMTVRGNHIHANNKLCPKTPRLPFLQGSGIVLTGTEKTLVTKNRVEDNVGTSPLSGGIVLFKSFVGAPNESNEIRDNVVLRNSTADLADRDTGQEQHLPRQHLRGLRTRGTVLTDRRTDPPHSPTRHHHRGEETHDDP